MSIRNGFSNINGQQNDNDKLIRSCPTSPPAVATVTSKNWWPQSQLRPQSQQSQAQQPRRQPFPLRKPEVTIKEYPGCASTGNYRLIHSSQESLNNNQSLESNCGSPHLLRPSKFWPQSQQIKLQPQHQQTTNYQQQMQRQTSQPCLSTNTEPKNERYASIKAFDLPKQQTLLVTNQQPQQSHQANQQQQQFRYNRSSDNICSPYQQQLQFQQPRQQVKQPSQEQKMWPTMNRTQSQSTGRINPVDVIGHNRQYSAFHRPESHSSTNRYLQQPFEPAFGRQAITPPPYYTYDYHRASPSPPPLVQPPAYISRPQSAMNGFSGNNTNGHFSISRNGSTDTLDQFHSANSTPYSSQPNLVVINRSPMGSTNQMNHFGSVGHVGQLQSPLSYSPQPPQPGAKQFYYTSARR